MAALILVKPGRDWQATGGLFEWTLEYLIPRLADRATADWLRTVVDNHLDQLWIPDLSEQAQQEIFELLRDGLVATAERDLPESEAKGSAVARLQELVDLTFSEPA